MFHSTPIQRIASRWLNRRKIAVGKGDVATYKGRKYKVLFAGPTRFGDRAHLEFFDGSKSFWVDLDKVDISGGSSRRDRGGSRVQVKYWNGRREWMSEEDASMVEDMGDGHIL